MGDSGFRAKALMAAGFTLIAALGFFLAFVAPGGFARRDAREIRLGLFAGSAWKVPNPTTNRLYDGLIADFRAQHPQYMIRYRSGVRAQDYSERLAQDLVKGEEPDLFFILPEDFTTLASIGALADLGPLMKESGVDPAIFYENALTAGRLGERQYALPFEVVPSLMFVNLTLLKKLGLSLPDPSWRWEDFLAYTSAATRDRDGNGALDTFGISGYTWPDAAYSNREPLFDSVGGNATLEQDGVVDAVDFFLRLGDPTRGSIVPDFESGAVLFAPFPYSAYRAYKYYPYSIQRFGDFRWKALTMPRGPKGGNAGELRVLLVGMSRRAADRKAAWEFLRHITTDDESAFRILAFSQGLPARRGLLDTERARSRLRQHISGDEEPLDPTLLEALVAESVVAPRFRNHTAALEIVSRAIAAERPQSSSSLRNFLSKLDHSVDAFLKE